MKREMVAYTTVDIATLIVAIRGKRVILDRDLAGLYGTTTKRLNEQVKRNRNRFPEDFMFQLTTKEWADLTSQIAMSNAQSNRSQFATGSQRHRDPRFTPLCRGKLWLEERTPEKLKGEGNRDFKVKEFNYVPRVCNLEPQEYSISG